MDLSGLGLSRLVKGKANVLGGIYAKAYIMLINEMNSAAATMWQRDRATVMLARVDSIVKGLDAETLKFVNKEVPATYFETATAAKIQARKLGLVIPAQFGQIHTEATTAIAKDSMLKFGHTMIGIKRSTEEIVTFARQAAIREQIAAGQITGASADKIAKDIKSMIADQGITVLRDKSGKNWQLDTYSEMLTRQVLANSGRDGISNTAQEYGLDLVQISDHNSSHAECAKWEGKIVSLTGKTDGYPTMDQAMEEGLFHVGCKHGYTIARENLKHL